MTLLKWMIIAIIVCFSVPVLAVTVDSYPFNTVQEQNRFSLLTQEFRCLVCQNESLADSNAPLAQDLRQRIALLIKQNATDDEIKEYLVKRYGNFVLFRPPVTPLTYALWFSPIVLLGVTLFILIFLISKQKPEELLPLSSAEQQKIARLLNHDHQDRL